MRSDLSPIFPGTALYVQLAAVSKRYGWKNFPIGTEIHYHDVSFEACPEQTKLALARLINTELEIPSFSPQSKNPLPYPPEQFLDLFAIQDAITLLAWRTFHGQADPTLVGYLIGGPYINYPDHLKVTEPEVQPENVTLLPEQLHLPNKDTWLFDTFAVREDQRGLQIGKQLLEQMLERAFYPGSPWQELASFAVEHKTSWTREMLLNNPMLQQANVVIDRRIPYRNKYAHYIVVDMKPVVVRTASHSSTKS